MVLGRGVVILGAAPVICGCGAPFWPLVRLGRPTVDCMQRLLHRLVGPKVPAALLILVLVLMTLAWFYASQRSQEPAAAVAPEGWQLVELDFGQTHPDEAHGWYCTTVFRGQGQSGFQRCLVREDAAAVGPPGRVVADEPSSSVFEKTMLALTAAGTLLAGVAAIWRRPS